MQKLLKGYEGVSVDGRVGGGMRAHLISALVLRRAHLAWETLAFPKTGKRPLQWQEEGSLRPEMVAQPSALTGPCVYRRMRERMSVW